MNLHIFCEIMQFISEIYFIQDTNLQTIDDAIKETEYEI